MKNEWTEQDLPQFVESSRPVFQHVSLTQVDEDADRCWQDDGLMVDYELRGGQVDCVLRRCVVADGKVWQLQMTAPLAGNDLPEDRMTPREREMCRDDMNHDFVTGVFNRRYYETDVCTKLYEWTDCHRCAALALVLTSIGVPALAFALGMFIPMELNAPLVVGCLVAWFVSNRSKDEALNKARFDRGTLIASGFIAGGALMGVVSALLKFAEVDWFLSGWASSNAAEWT